MWPFSSSGVKFTEKDIPSLQGKVFLVTGGNSGLGKQSIIDLARHEPQEIWLTSRTVEKANEAIKDIKKIVPNANIKPLALELDSFESIKAAARTFNAGAQRLDVLMLNAGIMAAPEALTKDGYELQLGTNHVGHALLAKLLAPVLDKTAAQAGADVRVVVLSSAGIRAAPEGGIVFGTLKTMQPALGIWGRYGQSKLANALFARQLARQHPNWTVTAIHPGSIQTNLPHHVVESYPLMSPVLSVCQYFLTTVQDGAQNQLWAATAPKEAIKTGELYYPVGSPTVGNDRGPYVLDDALAKRLWDWTEEELKGQTV